MRSGRNSPPNFRLWFPFTQLRLSINERLWLVYGWPRPFCVLLDRTRPPSREAPAELICPPMPGMVALPVKSMEIGVDGWALSHWKRAHYLGDGRHRACARRQAGDGPDEVDPGALPQPFVVGKEK